MIEDDSTIAFGVKYALEQEGINIDISKDDLVEEEYYNACEEAVQALQYTFNLV